MQKIKNYSSKVHLYQFAFACLIFVIFNESSCHPYNGDFKPNATTCDTGNTVKLPQDVVNKLFFKDSTYWVYKDSITGITDSVWVLESLHEVFNTFHNKLLFKKCYERYLYITLSNFSGRSIISIEPNSVDDELKYEEQYFNVNYSLEKYSYNSIYRFFLKGNNYLTNEDGGSFEIISNYKFGNTYIEVLHLIYKSTTFDIYQEAYYASNIGLIKYRLKDGHSWELQRFKIYQ